MSTRNCELADQTSIRAFRAGRDLLIVAEGEMPSPGYEADIAQSPIRIFPPQFNLLRCPRPGVFPQVVTPYRVGRTFAFPPDQTTVTVHHAAGAADVPIEECPAPLGPYAQAMGGEGAVPGCPEGADEATGFSRALSFDEAFAGALAKLPPDDRPLADALARVQVVEVGGLFGGIAGFHDLYVRVCRTIT